jgi:hypothetical protein
MGNESVDMIALLCPSKLVAWRDGADIFVKSLDKSFNIILTIKTIHSTINKQHK